MQDGDKHPDTTLPSFVKRAVVAQAIVIFILVWGYASWRIRSDEVEVLDSARHELRAVASGMYVHMQAVLNDSVGAARAAAISINGHGGLDAITPTQAADLLSRELSSGDYVRALFVADEGHYVSVTRDEQILSFESWPQWFDLSDQRQRNVYIGARIPDPIDSSQHAIPIAVRVTRPGGESVWAGALLGVEALDQLYESMAIRDGSLSLMSMGGDLLLRVPQVPGGERAINLGQTQLFKQADAAGEGGFLEGPSPIVDGTWLYAFRNISSYRLVVTAARDKRAILQPWRDRTRSLIYVLAGVSVLFLALTALLKNFMLRVERANTTLAQLNSELESRVAARTSELQSANQRLALTNQELEAFTASASHDLRSPLGAIAGQAGLLRDELHASMNDSIRSRIDRIQSCVRRSSDIIDGLLSLARISRQELLNERVDLSALAQSIVDDLKQQYPRQSVECRIEPKLSVNADPRLMKSLLYNLLGNAWKYTSRTEYPRVELVQTDARDTTVFSVRDNGAGFDMAGAEHIFEPFHRLHSASEFPGIGIGLATVARIVQRYAGKITVESVAGKGTTFRFTLPAAALAGA
ncbi:MAG TPA: ATP-binding protein [Steroidobacteraceae bacterium]|nr:ATP-binding protein [Steroidobacteraceae bacterium]